MIGAIGGNYQNNLLVSLVTNNTVNASPSATGLPRSNTPGVDTVSFSNDARQAAQAPKMYADVRVSPA